MAWRRIGRRQAIIWTNTDLIHWRIYAELEGNELIKLEQTNVLCLLTFADINLGLKTHLSDNSGNYGIHIDGI